MRIQHNIMAMNAYRNYNNNTSALSKNLEKLSSGYKINRAGDDAAGLAISEKMRAQITGLQAASKNVKDGVSLVKTAEGALQEVHDMLNRMDSLATQSANGTYDNDVDRLNLQKEVEALTKEINRIAESTNFNGKKLLDGSLDGTYTLDTANLDASLQADKGISSIDVSQMAGKYELKDTAAADASKVTIAYDSATKTFTMKYTADDKTGEVSEKVTLDALPKAGEEKTVTFSNGLSLKVNNKLTANIAEKEIVATKDATKGLTLQIGDTAQSFNQMAVNVKSMKAADLGIDTLTVANQDGAAKAIDSIKKAINTVSGTRGDLGAIQNRLEHTQNNLSVMTENIQDAESTIRDTDVADEMMAYTKNNILIQSAQAMLAQANQVPQGVLQLLQ